MRIGLLGGTFDPIHLAHLLIAEEARVKLELEEVVFVPTGEPWMKAGQPLSPGEHRLNMVRLAIATNPFFRVSSVELDRPGPSYTVDTLETLRQEMGHEVEFCFLLGLDSLKSFHRWKEPARVLELCTLVAVARPGRDAFDPTSLDAQVGEGASQRVVLLDSPQVDISGTDIRQRVAQGLSIRYRVPDEVARYITSHGLYRGREVGK